MVSSHTPQLVALPRPSVNSSLEACESRCTAEPVGVHFLWAPLYSQHGDRIQRYLAHRNASRPLVVVGGVPYHNVGSTVPPGCCAESPLQPLLTRLRRAATIFSQFTPVKGHKRTAVVKPDQLQPLSDHPQHCWSC